MSAPKVDIRGYVSIECNELLEALATTQRKTKTELVGEVIERAIMGEGHNLRVAAEELQKHGILRKLKE